MLNAVPIVMVKNEEYYIAQVLTVLATAFGTILVADTGSTDKTCELVRSVPQARLFVWPTIDTTQLGKTRQRLCEEGRKLGFGWAFQCDGDELYYPDALERIVAQDLPEGKNVGMTAMVTVDKDEQGQMWAMSDNFSRVAVYPLNTGWHSDYPYEAPNVFDDHGEDNRYYYTGETELGVHALHLHRLVRSPRDKDVMLREKKRLKFSMQDQQHHRVKMIERWPIETSDTTED